MSSASSWLERSGGLPGRAGRPSAPQAACRVSDFDPTPTLTSARPPTRAWVNPSVCGGGGSFGGVVLVVCVCVGDTVLCRCVCVCVCDLLIFSQKQRNKALTLAHGQTTLTQVTRLPIGEPARQSACEKRPSARHAPLAAYVAPVVEDVQEHAFCLREILHLRMALESFELQIARVGPVILHQRV